MGLEYGLLSGRRGERKALIQKRRRRKGKDTFIIVHERIITRHVLQILVGLSVMIPCLRSRGVAGVALVRAMRVVRRIAVNFMVSIALLLGIVGRRAWLVYGVSWLCWTKCRHRDGVSSTYQRRVRGRVASGFPVMVSNGFFHVQYAAVWCGVSLSSLACCPMGVRRGKYRANTTRGAAHPRKHPI